jgi:hypothetical protein
MVEQLEACSEFIREQAPTHVDSLGASVKSVGDEAILLEESLKVGRAAAYAGAGDGHHGGLQLEGTACVRATLACRAVPPASAALKTSAVLAGQPGSGSMSPSRLATAGGQRRLYLWCHHPTT